MRRAGALTFARMTLCLTTFPTTLLVFLFITLTTTHFIVNAKIFPGYLEQMPFRSNAI